MLVIGSRGSQLALWQAQWIAGRLAGRGQETRIEIIKTTGDKITDVPLAKVGTKGLFTKEIEEALLEGRIDLAVHSLKDLPTEIPAGLTIAAIPEREDPRDALVGVTLSNLKAGAKIGTSSLRRAAQLRAIRKDLRIESVRGNLDTRVRKLDEGQYDAIVLASAGLTRLGWAHRVAEILSPEMMCPAVGQGALAVETRMHGLAHDICGALDHATTRAAVTAERAVLASLGGGCQVPIGAHAQVSDGVVQLIGVVISPDGEQVVRQSDQDAVADAENLGRRVGAALLKDGAREILEQVYGAPRAGFRRMKPVYLVGAGPGDPGLITVKGSEVLGHADVVLYDHLANEALLRLAPSQAELIYVGKKKAEHARTQEEICEIMIERARRGLQVVRLKGGDPFIFGRGGEEAEALADAGVPFEVVPGVTSPLGIAAYTGVPLTHRDHTSVVTFVTGHDVARIDWDRVGHAETLVIFMGLTTFGQVAQEIIRRGRSPETPAMAVRWGTRADQETVCGTLGTLPRLIERSGLKPPATIIVGEVVRLREKLDWYGRLPLLGQRIVVTRAREQAETLGAKLRALGADVIEMPAIEIVPAADYEPLDRAIRELDSYDWLLFTSANGVRYFVDRLDASARDLRAIRARVCAIGEATKSAIESLHLKVDLIGEEFVAESLVEAFRSIDLEGRRILLPRAAVARDVLPRELRARGACVDVVEAYRTVAPENAARQAAELFSGARKVGWLTFTSSSTVQNFVQAAGAAALRGVNVASIGPVTTATAKELGLTVTVEASVYTTDGLVEAILRHSV